MLSLCCLYAVSMLSVVCLSTVCVCVGLRSSPRAAEGGMTPCHELATLRQTPQPYIIPLCFLENLG